MPGNFTYQRRASGWEWVNLNIVHSKMLKILQHKERRLKAELEILKSQDIEGN